MAIKNFGAGMTFTGRDIDVTSFIATLSALKLEVNTGMKMTRGYSAYATVKKMFGLNGNKQKVLEQFTMIVEETKQGRFPEGYKFRNAEDAAKRKKGA